MGFLFDLEKVDKININRRFPAFEYKLPELQAKSTYTSPETWYCFGNNWQQIRKMWLDKYRPSPRNDLEYYREAKSNKQFGLMLENASDISRGIILSKNEKNIDITFKTVGTATLKGTVEIETKESILNKSNIVIDDPKIKSWKNRIPIGTAKTMMTNGSIIYDCDIRKYKTPIALAFYDSKSKVKVSKGKHEGKEFYQVDNGFLQFRGSKDHRGHIYHLSADGSDENLLLTFFPEIKPFMWFSEFHGGMSSIIHPSDMWIGEEKFYELTFDVSEVTNGQWKGIAVKTSIIDYTPSLKGLQMTTSYLTLPNTPLILVQQKITNHSQLPRVCYLAVRASPNVSKSTKDKSYYTSTTGEILSLSMQDFESRSWRDKKKYNKWVAYKKDGSKNYIGLVTLTSKYADDTFAYTPNLSFMNLGRDSVKVTIESEETINIYDLFIITDDLANIEPFSQSNVLDLLEDK
jgi:hypothetical protein